METIVMWALIAVLQTHGAMGGVWGNQAACEQTKGELLTSSDTLWLSECVPITLLKKDLVAK